VHLFHGVGIFSGITKNTLSGTEREYIEIEYAEKDRLFVPVDELHRVSKFVGENSPTLTRLGSPAWKEILAKTNIEIQKIAEELLANHAARRLAGGISMPDFPEKEETFHLSFGHRHTQDQEEAIRAITADMSAEHPMDRLLSGDVGFGKTEVSLHAVYRAFLNHKQTIFLAPLVVLAYEHYESITERMKPFGINIALLTRMSTTKEINSVLKGLKDGSIHCVVGTHRLLSPDIKFHDL
jgi:transcription-repair coupling factor (superfamily II helicase)